MSRIAFVLLITIVPSVQAQVVQLPSVHNFSVQTTVSVPDSGGAYLGGLGRGEQSRRSQGWGPRGYDTSRTGTVMGSGMMVHATIIDHQELDEKVLAEGRALRAARGIRDEEPRPMVKAPAGSSGRIESVAAIKRRLAAEDAALEAEAQKAFDQAVAYEKAGEHALARSYFRLAERKRSVVGGR